MAQARGVAREAGLDGIYVIRTSLPAQTLSDAETVGAYKGLARVERAFQSLKSIDLQPTSIWASRGCAPTSSCACSPTMSSGICAKRGRPSYSTTTNALRLRKSAHRPSPPSSSRLPPSASAPAAGAMTACPLHQLQRPHAPSRDHDAQHRRLASGPERHDHPLPPNPPRSRTRRSRCSARACSVSSRQPEPSRKMPRQSEKFSICTMQTSG